MLNKQTAMERALAIERGETPPVTLRERVVDALLAVQAETLEAAAKVTCPSCGTGIPLIVVDGQELVHQHGDYRSRCIATNIRRLKETPK